MRLFDRTSVPLSIEIHDRIWRFDSLRLQSPPMSIFPLIPLFIFGAVALGAGVMLAPGLPRSAGQAARQRGAPRIGLAAALALAFVIAGALFLAALFGWDSLTVDYLWFAVLVALFLTGTLAARRARHEAAGLGARAIGWPGARELVFFGLVLALFALPILILPVPLDTDAQGFGYLALSLRESGSLTTLAPFHPETEYLYSPGFVALAAYLSDRLGIGLHVIMPAIAAVLGLLFVWLLYDLGNEVEDWLDGDTGAGAADRPPRHAGAVLALMGLFGVGLLTAYMDSHFTTVLALVFGLAFLTFVIRYLRGGRWPDALCAVACLSAVPLTHPDTTLILILGYVPWLGTLWLARPRPAVRTWLVLALVVPGLALLGILPWLARIAPLLGSSIESPFEISPEHWKALVFMHGGLIVPLALGGAAIAVRRRTPLDLLMVGWLVFVVDFSTTGILPRLLPGLLAPLLKYDYPFSIAWHGPIIPYAYLGATAVLWLARRTGWARVRGWVGRLAWPALSIGAAILVLGGLLAPQVLAASKGVIGFYGAFSSHADVQAMEWLKANTPPETRVLNFPGPQEGDWVPVISERDTVYFRPQPFFRHTEAAEAEQAAFETFWNDPADPANAALFARYGVGYVLVPQVVGNPESFAEMWRWRSPFAWEWPMESTVADASYLELVIDFDGAQVWQVIE